MLFESLQAHDSDIYREGPELEYTDDVILSVQPTIVAPPETQKPHFSLDSLSFTGIRDANIPWSDQPPNLPLACGYVQRPANCTYIADAIENFETGSIPWSPNKN